MATLTISLPGDVRHGCELLDKLDSEWLRENVDAINAYNQFVETNGTFSDSVRKF